MGYGTLGAGWRRNRKYALLGAIRATAQTVSYEVRIRLVVLSAVIFTPFDFAEGESELVSGFNTEYRSVLFVIIFLAEYISIIFISLFSSILFMGTRFFNMIISTLIVAVFYI